MVEWEDDGFIVSVSRFGESDMVLEILTRDHGRHLGLVKGGASKSRRGDLLPGNRVAAVWKARLSDHLGRFDVELIRPYAAMTLDSAQALAGVAAATALASACLPERERHPAILAAFEILIEALAGPDAGIAPVIFVKFEAGLLQDLGFGLDLSSCAVTGARDDLAFVSPRTGRAVARAAAAPYAPRLLPLPMFLLGNQTGMPDRDDLAAGFRLTRHFLDQSVLAPHGRAVPAARDHYADLVTR